MNNRHVSIGLVVCSVFAVAVALRSLPLFWSPLPATGDGFMYVALARDTIALGEFPLAEFNAYGFVFVGFLTALGLVLDQSPLYIAQPIITIVGAASCLAVVAIVYRVGIELSWPKRKIAYAIGFTGFALAVEGLYLRRSGVPDEEAIALVFLPLVAFALAKYWRSSRIGWLLIATIFLIALPLTQMLTTLMTALTITALLAVQLQNRFELKSGIIGVSLVGAFWVYFIAYYEFAQKSILTVPYTDRILSHPGLFVAWIVILIIGVIWFNQTSNRFKQAAFLLPFAGGLAILVLNVFTLIFPGTIASPNVLALLVLLYAIPLIIASRQVNLLSESPTGGAVLLALFAAPSVNVYFSLTAELSPDYFDTVMRSQTFWHFTVFALAGLAVAEIVHNRAHFSHRLPSAQSLLIGVLVVSVLLTVPIGLVELDTLEVPSTTQQDEFAGVEFASTYASDEWATDKDLSHKGVHYFNEDVAITPVATWLDGGSPPTCTMVSKRAWTETGAHFFPSSPRTISNPRYQRTLETRNVIYVSSGPKHVVISTPTTNDGSGC